MSSNKTVTNPDLSYKKHLKYVLTHVPRNTDPLNVIVKHGRLDTRHNFFSIRVTEDWNRVPSDIKKMRSVEGFKNSYAMLRANIAPVGRV